MPRIEDDAESSYEEPKIRRTEELPTQDAANRGSGVAYKVEAVPNESYWNQYTAEDDIRIS